MRFSLDLSDATETELTEWAQNGFLEAFNDALRQRPSMLPWPKAPPPGPMDNLPFDIFDGFVENVRNGDIPRNLVAYRELQGIRDECRAVNLRRQDAHEAAVLQEKEEAALIWEVIEQGRGEAANAKRPGTIQVYRKPLKSFAGIYIREGTGHPEHEGPLIKVGCSTVSVRHRGHYQLTDSRFVVTRRTHPLEATQAEKRMVDAIRDAGHSPKVGSEFFGPEALRDAVEALVAA